MNACPILKKAALKTPNMAPVPRAASMVGPRGVPRAETTEKTTPGEAARGAACVERLIGMCCEDVCAVNVEDARCNLDGCVARVATAGAILLNIPTSCVHISSQRPSPDAADPTTVFHMSSSPVPRCSLLYSVTAVWANISAPMLAAKRSGLELRDKGRCPAGRGARVRV